MPINPLHDDGLEQNIITLLHKEYVTTVTDIQELYLFIGAATVTEYK